MYPDVSHSNPNRYVITNPPAELSLLPSDQVKHRTIAAAEISGF